MYKLERRRFNEEIKLANISSIGTGGCFIDTENPFNTGEVFTVEIEFPAGIWVPLPAESIYVLSSKGIGVSFNQLSEDERSMLEEILKYVQLKLQTTCYRYLKVS
jgi:hypothetical protein